jgi:hypothetical protein
MFWHEYPSLSGPWFAKRWPDRNERILAIYNAGGKVDLQDKLQELTEAGVPQRYHPIKDADLPFA